MSLRIGMVGLGVISKFYAAGLKRLRDPVLTAVCDLNEARMDPYREFVPCFADYRLLLASPEVDAVVINVPNDQHFALCREALLAGKHVCCEKPLTLTVAEAAELAALSRQTDRTLFTAFHRRYNVNFRQVLEQLPDRTTIARVTASYLERIEDHAGSDRWYLQPERCGGGCVADNGPNVFDTLSFFLGRLDVVAAEIWCDPVTGIDLQARIELRTVDGIPVEVDLDWAYNHGEKKDVGITLASGQHLHADMMEGFAVFKSSLYHEYEAILHDFAEQVAMGGTHGEDGLDAVRLVADTYRLARSTNIPVAR